MQYAGWKFLHGGWNSYLSYKKHIIHVVLGNSEQQIIIHKIVHIIGDNKNNRYSSGPNHWCICSRQTTKTNRVIVGVLITLIAIQYTYLASASNQKQVPLRRASNQTHASAHVNAPLRFPHKHAGHARDCAYGVQHECEFPRYASPPLPYSSPNTFLMFPLVTFSTSLAGTILIVATVSNYPCSIHCHLT